MFQTTNEIKDKCHWGTIDQAASPAPQRHWLRLHGDQTLPTSSCLQVNNQGSIYWGAGGRFPQMSQLPPPPKGLLEKDL